ncbi:hypothetical protein SeMB42_g07916 [Synchytrium endobioticum]|uniref:Uncharacterized protein n=1 Tax=Synchytrium endobioticum TaxID=286115 RepID=A0A507BXM5_9FUNG|nr:hypothetical protein SeMB42_g07916 [Synchytrium endobioticum]TPX31888.1 hypothetical protein SeLEV6574_g08505 [Synchytrium endobioticum]
MAGPTYKLQSIVDAERAEKLQSQTLMQAALSQLDQQKRALLDMSRMVAERDAQLSKLQNESQKKRDEVDALRAQTASLRKNAATKANLLRKASDMLKDINQQREADINGFMHAVEVARKEAANGNRGELGLQNKVKHQPASQKQNSDILPAQVEPRAEITNDASSDRFDVKALQVQVARLHQVLTAARAESSSAMPASAMQQLQALTAENTSLKDRIDGSTRHNSVKVQHLQSELSKLYDQAEQRSEEHQQELANLTEVHARMLRCTEREREAVEQTLDHTTRELHALRALHAEIGTMKQQASEPVTLHEREQMTRQVETAKQETARLQRVNEAYAQDLDAQKARLEDQERLIAAAQREIDALQTQLTSREDVAQQNGHLHAELRKVVVQLAEKTDECNCLLKQLDQNSIAHRQDTEDNEAAAGVGFRLTFSIWFQGRTWLLKQGFTAEFGSDV